MSAEQLVILGLDGGDWNIVDRLIERGDLPVLSRLAAGGIRTVLRSTLPPATLPAWNAFLCGAEPTHHGVTDMFVHPPRSYALVPASAALRRLPTFLGRLAQAGLEVASLGVPGTYPPDRRQGLCIAGFDAPGVSRARRDAIWPPELVGELARAGGWRYAVFNEQRGGRRRLRGALAALLADLEAKEKWILAAYRRRRWNVFFAHVQAADTAGHHLWPTFDPGSPRRTGPELADAIPAVYRRIDTLLGKLLAAAPPTARLLIVSDHGMGGASDLAIHLNRVLHEAGVLAFRRTSGAPVRRLAGRLVRRTAGALPVEVLGGLLRFVSPSLVARLVGLARNQEVDFEASAAFSDELDYGPAVWLNRRGVFPHGLVGETEAPALVDRVRERLSALTHPVTGERLIRAVHNREELGGPAASAMPDLVLEPAWPGGYRPSFLPSPGPGPAIRRLARHELLAPRGSGMPGVHRREGMLLAYGPGLPALEAPALTIAEAGALVYPLVGVASPADLPAQLTGFWAALGEALAHSGSLAAEPARPLEGLSPREQVTVAQRLRSLGYIE